MELINLVIREINQPAGGPAATSSAGGSVDTQNPVALETVSSMNGALSRRATLTHGAFNQENDEGLPFVSAFGRYVESDHSSEAFLQFSDTAMQQLIYTINQSESDEANKGYVIFSHFEEERFSYLLIGLVRTRTSITFNDQLNPTEVMEADLSKLQQAAKININSYQLGKDSYLSFTGGKDRAEQAVFTSAFGCTDVIPSKKSTGELIRAARDFCSQNGLEEQREQVVEDVVSYLSRQREDKQSANLMDIDQVLDSHIPAEQAEDLCGKFSKFANSTEYGVSQEFQPHNHTLTSITKVKAKADNWQLEFSKKSLGLAGSGKDVEFDEQTNSVHLKRLPTKVIEQIKQALLAE